MKDSKSTKRATPRRPWKGEDQIDTDTKVHVPKNKKSRKTEKTKALREQLDGTTQQE